MFNLFRFVGLRHLMMKPTRSILTTVGVALGVALFIGIEIINRSTLASFKENVEAVAGKATLSVSAGETGFPEEKLEEIQKIPGVKHAIPMIESRGYFSGSTKSNSQTLMVLGVDLLREQSVRTYKTTDQQIIDDPLVFLNQPDSIIITHEFAQAQGLKQGSTFYLATAHGTQKFTVRGMLSPVGPAKAYGGAIAIMDIDGARMTFGKLGKLDRVDIVTRENEAIEDVSDRIQKRLGPGYQIERPEARSAGMERMVKSYQTMMSFFSSLALLVGLFLVSNSISISVAERRREIGTLRAMGATRKGILTLFLSEAVAMGAIGAFLGAWLGRLLASALVGVMARSMSARYLTSVQISHLKFGMSEVLHAVVIGATAAFVAAVWPAFRAASIQPLEAMRRQDVGKDAAQKGFFRYSPYLAIGMLAFVNFSYWMNWPQRSGAMENLNQVFSILGATLLGPALVTLLIRIFRPLAIPLGGTVMRLAQDNLIRNPRRTGSNVMSLMVGLMLVVMIAAVNVSFKTTLMDWFDRILRSDLIVSSTGQVISYQMQPIDESLGREIEQVPGVRKGPLTGAYGLRFVHIRYEGKQLGVKAYDEPDPSFKYSTLDVLDRPVAEAGYELYHSEKPAVLISENFALHFNKKRGDILNIETPMGLVPFKVVGTLVDFASDTGVLYFDRKVYKAIWKDPLVSAFGVQILPGYDVEKVRQEIVHRLGPSKGLLVTSNAELRKQMMDVIEESFTDSRAIEVAALLVGLLGLLNTLLISVMERMRELGMLRAVGMSRRQLTRMIFQEALFQGGFGAVSAVILGAWFSYFWITYSFSHVLGWIIHFHFPWSSVFTTVITGLVVAWVAGVFPARKAGHLEITEALEYE